MTIGKVAQSVGVTIDTLRFYERQGIITPTKRNRANYRIYSEDAVRRVRFVKRAQDLGFTLADIKELLSLRTSKTVNCADIRQKATDRIELLDQKIRSLRAMRQGLLTLASECPGDRPTDDCPILDALDGKRSVPRATATRRNGT